MNAYLPLFLSLEHLAMPNFINLTERDQFQKRCQAHESVFPKVVVVDAVSCLTTNQGITYYKVVTC